MSPKSLAVLALATAASIALAVHAVQDRDEPIRSAASGGVLFPDLLDRLNDVRELRIAAPEGSFTVVNKDQVWSLAEKAGYPVDPDRVRQLGLALANLRLVEPKTADPGKLARLELEDPAGEGAKSRLIELEGPDGSAIASAVVGKPSPSLYGSGRGGVYVRRSGDNQAWLAAGELELPASAMELIGEDVVDLPTEQVARVVLDPAGTSPVTLARPDANGDFTVDVQLPEGRKLDPTKAEFLAGALSNLTMSDVTPASGLPAEGERRELRFETFDGLPITVQVATIGEGDAAVHWVTLGTAATSEADKANSPLATRIGELEGWAYQVPAYLADRLRGGLDTLLAEPTPAS